MLFHSDPLFFMYFGNKKEGFPPTHFHEIHDNDMLAQQNPFALVAKLMGLRRFVLLKQTHSNIGYSLSTEKDLASLPPYTASGDYLITKLTGVGLGVATADCLPIIIYDPHNNAVGIAHAGWKGSATEIARIMLDAMKKQHGTAPHEVRVFFGPSAKVCCYAIQPDFLTNLEQFEYASEAIRERHDQLFFDLPLFNQLQLESAGIPASAFHHHYNICTMCNPSFCSHRRDGAAALRQMTIVALK